MGSSIKINSISIDLAAAADEIDPGKCQHFSIRGFVAEIRERDHRKCWPFSADTVELGDNQNYSLPSLSLLKSRWWRCASCIKDINDTTDCQLQSHSRYNKEKKLDADHSSAIASKRRLNSTIFTDKKGKKNDDETAATILLKKVRRRAKDASSVKSKGKKLARPEQVSKRSREKANISTEISWKEHRVEAVTGGEAVTAFGSSEIAGVVDDTPKKAVTEDHRNSHVLVERDEYDYVSSESLTGLHRRKSRKSRKVRLLSDLLGNRNMETLSKMESVRGSKRKSCGEATNYASRILSTIGKASENVSKSCDSEDNTVSGTESRPSVQSQSTDSGFEKDTIKGKQRNRRFQVVEEPLQKDTYDYAGPVHSSFAARELVPCSLHTQRTEKELSLAKKRKRKAVIENKKSTMITFSNNMDDGNLNKLRKPDDLPQGSPRNTMPQSTRDFLNSKWLDSSFEKLSVSDGHFNKYTPQLDDRPVFPLPFHEKIGDDCAMLKDARKNHFRDFGSSFKSTNAVGCLRTGVNVDFSSTRNTTGSSYLNDKRRHTSSTEAADSCFALQKDISLAHGKGKEVAVQELSGPPKIQSKTPENIDDIPMEIVELMAKNQYERCLPDREEDKQPSQATTSVSKNALLIDLNETYDNSMDNTLRQPKPLGKSAVTNNSLEFFPGSQFGQPYNVPSGFGISAPLTRETQSSSIQFSGVVGPNRQSSHNCHWLGNVQTTRPSPSPFRVLRPCNTCQSVQQQQYRETSHPIWPASMTSSHAHKQSPLNMPQRNLNFVDNGKQKRGFEAVSSKSLDSYSSESSIPAMQLLSLMDPRLRSNIPIDQSRNSKFVKRPFSPVHQSKVLVGPQPGDCNKTAYSTKQWPFDLYSKRVAPETCCENFSLIPPVGTSSFSFQSEKTCAENADFTFQASWNHHSKRKDNNLAPVYSNSHHQKPIFRSSKSSDPGKFRLLGASDSMMLPLKFHMTDNAKKHKTKKPQSYNAVSASPQTSTYGPFVCSFNRNPADFTIADAPGNVYMIKGEDLKLRKQAGFRRKTSLCKQDALKQNKKPIAPAAENASNI